MRILATSLLIACLLTAKTAFALAISTQANNHINDYAHVLSPQSITTLNNQLQQFEQQTTNQIFVAIFPSLENEPISDFTTRLEDQWKIEQQGKRILIVIFVKEHRARIEVSYGLKSAVSDALAMQIIQNDILPSFKAKNYVQGIEQAINALMSATDNIMSSSLANSTQQPQKTASAHSDSSALEDAAAGALYLTIVIIILVGAIRVSKHPLPQENDPTLTPKQRRQIKRRKFYRFILRLLIAIFVIRRDGRRYGWRFIWHGYTGEGKEPPKDASDRSRGGGASGGG